MISRYEPHYKNFIGGLLLKLIVSLTLFLYGTVGLAQSYLPNYNWTLTDISKRGLNRDSLQSEMDRNFVKVGNSICSNRAHMWAHDFKQKYGLDTAKIFVFYTAKRGDENRTKVWWYHVAPVILENNKQFVMDPAFARTAITKEDWFQRATHFSKCREIAANENELLERIFNQRTFPKQTAYGKHDCYYHITPHTFWIPQHIPMNLLGVDEKGKPVRLDRPEINSSDLYQACIEATTTKIEYAMGVNRAKCKEIAGL